VSCDTDVVLFHFDYAENFKCAAQDQIQAAYYNQHQISLFTVVVKTKGATQSLVLVSDDAKDHGKEVIMKNLLFLFEVRRFTLVI
jgi:hypothetical protein